jgi:hypothetical protein
MNHAHSEAATYLAGLNETTRGLAAITHELFGSEGCSSYVKTIYIGYDIDGEMVAALYGHADHVEVALALPEDAVGELLVDAGHLTWRTLPVAAIIRSEDDFDEATSLIASACHRVREREHAVERDNDFFIRSRRERRGQLRPGLFRD